MKTYLAILLSVFVFASMVSVGWGEEGSFLTDWEPPTTIIFGYADTEITFGIDEFESMTQQEMENFALLVMLCVETQIGSPVIEIWGKKLLPRFFKEAITE